MQLLVSALMPVPYSLLFLLGSVPEEEPVLKDLINLPIPHADWRILGSHLNIHLHRLNAIQANHNAVTERTIDMFQCWLDNDESPTYKSLIEGLLAAGMNKAVKFICSKYGMVWYNLLLLSLCFLSCAIYSFVKLT